MPQLKGPVSISVHVNLDQGSGVRPRTKKSDALPFPDGFHEIKARLKRRGESETYAKEHAARIWNDAHPEEPVETSFDGENGGFRPGNSDLSQKVRLKKTEKDDEDDA